MKKQKIKDSFWDTDLVNLPNSIENKLYSVTNLRKLVFGEISVVMGLTNQQQEGIYVPGIFSVRKFAYNRIKGIIYNDPRTPYSYTDILG